MNEKKQINLYLDEKDNWVMALYIDNAPDPTAVKIFGTHQLPLPFDSSIHINRVIETAERLYPTYKVKIDLLNLRIAGNMRAL